MLAPLVRVEDPLRVRYIVPAWIVRNLERHDLGAASLHFGGQESAGWADLEDTFSAELDAAEVLVDAPAQIPFAGDGSDAGQVHRMVEAAIHQHDRARRCELRSIMH